MQSPVAGIPRDDSSLSRGAAFALFWLLVASLAMFTLPFVAFFATRHYLTEQMQLESFTVTCCSVFASVLTVNLIIVLYALKGYREVGEEKIPTLDNSSGDEDKKDQ